MDLTVIVIGRNEGSKLKKCFRSIENCKKHLSSSFTFQTIYVDSDSSDKSIEVAISFNIDRIIKIEGEINAAVARNVGARFAENPWFVFLDGDMEIVPNFFEQQITKKYFGDAHFFSGQYHNIYYDNDWHKQKETTFKANYKVKRELMPGGLMVVKKSLWEKVGGMRNYYRISEDFDFGLRCDQVGYSFTLLNKLMAYHHTISRFDHKRIANAFRKNEYLYSRSLLYREHLFLHHNLKILRLVWKQDYTLIALILSFFSIYFLKVFGLLIYFSVILVKAFKYRSQGFFYFIFYLIFRDISILIGFIVFWPRKDLEFTHEVIK